MVKFTHYLITRFNVPESRWMQDKGGLPTLGDDWFEHRLGLFTAYCVPAIRHQSNQHFQWLIYCSQNTDPKHLERIKQAISIIAVASLRMVHHQDDMLKDLRAQISQASTPYVITSRLDNDDAIGHTYMETMQSHFSEKEKLLLHPDHGIVYDCTLQVATRSRSKAYHHFTSLIEHTKDSADLLTVYGFHHIDIPSGVEVLHIPHGYHWLKIIHDRNVRSRLKGIPVFRIPSNLSMGIDRASIRISWWATLLYLISRLTSRKTS